MTALRIGIAIVVGLLVVGLGRFWLLGKQSQDERPNHLGLTQGRLAPCPAKPNCVSSQADAADTLHFIPPLRYAGTSPDLKTRLKDFLANTEGFKLTEQNDRYLRAEFRSRLFGFVDDLEFYFPPETPGVAEVRSSSRVGHSDLGANRKRVEAIRRQLAG